MVKISIVIPTFNRKQELSNLLTQLSQQNCSDGLIQIIVVVDGSTDGTLEMLKSEFPSVKIVQGSGNWWFTKSMNEGIKYSNNFEPDYILCLNDDVEICDFYLNRILATVQKVDTNSIIGSASFTIKKPHYFITSGVKRIIPIMNKNIMYIKPFTQVDPGNYSGFYPSVSLSGRGTLMPYKVLKELNYFDERFVQYLSDIDLCLRAKKLGYKSFISWDAKLFVHFEKSSVSSSFLKVSFSSFLRSFFNKYSRNYVPNRVLFLFRHEFKWFFPLSFAFFILGSFKAFFFNKKV